MKKFQKILLAITLFSSACVFAGTGAVNNPAVGGKQSASNNRMSEQPNAVPLSQQETTTVVNNPKIGRVGSSEQAFGVAHHHRSKYSRQKNGRENAIQVGGKQASSEMLLNQQKKNRKGAEDAPVND